MKLKLKRQRHGVVLTGITRASEELCYAEAECVRTGRSDVLMPLSYAQRRRGWRFIYRAPASRPLQQVLRHDVSAEHLEAMLASFAEVGRACNDHDLALERVSFDVRFIVFDPARYALRFAYLPARIRHPRTSDPLQAIAHLAGRVRASDPASEALAASVLDYARRNLIFLWPTYASFLADHGVVFPRRTSAPMLRS